MPRMISAILLAAILLVAPLWAVDYDQIDRSLAKEPTYRSGKPEYTLLLFGPEARRVWVVIDGDSVYLDRNGDGDLTAANERFANSDDCKGIEISGRDGKTRYVITRLNVHRDKDNKWPPFVMAWVEIHGPPEYQQYCDARLGKTPRDAAIAHFHGPLAIGLSTYNWKVPPETVLTTGDKPGELQAFVGTMSERHHCWVAVVSHTAAEKCSFGDGVRPQVTIEFAAADSGEPAIVEQYTLDGFC